MRTIYLLLSISFYLLIGISSSVIEISEIQKPNAPKKVIQLHSRIPIEKNDVIMVLNGNKKKTVYDSKELVKNTENALISAGLHVVTDNKFDYLDNNEKVDYFVIIENYGVQVKEQQPLNGCNKSAPSQMENSNFYYYIVNAEDLEINYFSSFQHFSVEQITAPFLAKEYSVKTDECRYFNTFLNKEYNVYVSGGSDSQIQEKTKDLLLHSYSDNQINAEKKKQELINDKYILLINLATSEFLTEHYDAFEKTLADISAIHDLVSIKNNYTLKDDYVTFLKNEKTQLINSIPPSIPQVSRELRKTFLFDPYKDYTSDFQRMCLMNAYYKIFDFEFNPNHEYSIKVDLVSTLRNNCEGFEKHSGWFTERLKQLNLFTPKKDNYYQLQLDVIRGEFYFPLQCVSSSSKNNIDVRLNLKITKVNDGILINSIELVYQNMNPTALTTLPFRVDDMISKDLVNDKFKSYIKNTRF